MGQPSPDIACVVDGYIEAKLRRRIASNVTDRMRDQGLSIRALAERMRTSKSQVQRLLNKTRGGSLTLMTVVKAARALDASVKELML